VRTGDDIDDVFTYIRALIDYRLMMEERNRLTDEQSQISEVWERL